MAVNKNIGQISQAIAQGQIAYNNIDFGPESDVNIIYENSTIADFDNNSIDLDLFVFGFHKWGSVTNFKVDK